MRGTRRRAFTLTEVAVALAVASIVIIGVWSLFRLTERSFHANRKRLTSLQGAFLLTERLCAELRQAVVLEGLEPVVTDKDELLYHYFDAAASDLAPGTSNPVMALRPMRYRHVPDTGWFLRKDGSAAEREFRVARFECVLFHVPADPPPVPASRRYVSFRITCAADDDLEANRGKGDRSPDRRDREVVTLITAVGFQQAASRAAFPWWSDNPLPRMER